MILHHAWSAKSRRQLATVEPALRDVMDEALRLSPIDFTVLQGHRGEEAQDTAYARGQTQLRWPHGKHNALPSRAVDVAPVPIDWNDRERFCVLAGVIYAAARLCDVRVRWGGDWDSDGLTSDESFRDLGHFELVEALGPPPGAVAGT